ncbi:bacillithiol system protein YtxJ [Cnuella takakiae]|uniref:Bacillithiol system protein YtxJ n=1 Tax=Cnuella takakiae TaxID=1302690 RepID=A0A1M4Y475_9BACT|nr:bacillithiol system redox-active protein YtxJ [Cnuella takakiae]OLY93043.1 hypothetical protein BUE76_14910 [Cnuella takakiae]SHF00489.1 bacillithiol system protein YtxJ [Cnuella takakiae]
MQLTPLESLDQLKELSQSESKQVILKHNTTCPISKGVLQRLESTDAVIPGIATIHVLDLHAHRDVSDAIATQFGVEHQSPQLLVLQKGSCVYTEWGYDISAEATAEALEDVGN